MSRMGYGKYLDMGMKNILTWLCLMYNWHGREKYFKMAMTNILT